MVLPALQHHTNGTWPYNFSDLSFEWGGLGEPRDALWRWLFKDGALLENDPERHQFRVEQVQSRVRGQEIAHLQSDKLLISTATLKVASFTSKPHSSNSKATFKSLGSCCRVAGLSAQNRTAKD